MTVAPIRAPSPNAFKRTVWTTPRSPHDALAPGSSSGYGGVQTPPRRNSRTFDDDLLYGSDDGDYPFYGDDSDSAPAAYMLPSDTASVSSDSPSTSYSKLPRRLGGDPLDRAKSADDMVQLEQLAYMEQMYQTIQTLNAELEHERQERARLASASSSRMDDDATAALEYPSFGSGLHQHFAMSDVEDYSNANLVVESTPSTASGQPRRPRPVPPSPLQQPAKRPTAPPVASTKTLSKDQVELCATLGKNAELRIRTKEMAKNAEKASVQLDEAQKQMKLVERRISNREEKLRILLKEKLEWQRELKDMRDQVVEEKMRQVELFRRLETAKREHAAQLEQLEHERRDSVDENQSLRAQVADAKAHIAFQTKRLDDVMRQARDEKEKLVTCIAETRYKFKEWKEGEAAALRSARDQAVSNVRTEYELKIARHHEEKQKLRDKVKDLEVSLRLMQKDRTLSPLELSLRKATILGSKDNAGTSEGELIEAHARIRELEALLEHSQEYQRRQENIIKVSEATISRLVQEREVTALENLSLQPLAGGAYLAPAFGQSDASAFAPSMMPSYASSASQPALGSHREGPKRHTHGSVKSPSSGLDTPSPLLSPAHAKPKASAGRIQPASSSPLLQSPSEARAAAMPSSSSTFSLMPTTSPSRLSRHSVSDERLDAADKSPTPRRQDTGISIEPKTRPELTPPDAIHEEVVDVSPSQDSLVVEDVLSQANAESDVVKDEEPTSAAAIPAPSASEQLLASKVARLEQELAELRAASVQVKNKDSDTVAPTPAVDEIRAADEVAADRDDSVDNDMADAFADSTSSLLDDALLEDAVISEETGDEDEGDSSETTYASDAQDDTLASGQVELPSSAPADQEQLEESRLVATEGAEAVEDEAVRASVGDVSQEREIAQESELTAVAAAESADDNDAAHDVEPSEVQDGDAMTADTSAVGDEDEAKQQSTDETETLESSESADAVADTAPPVDAQLSSDGCECDVESQPDAVSECAEVGFSSSLASETKEAEAASDDAKTEDAVKVTAVLAEDDQSSNDQRQEPAPTDDSSLSEAKALAEHTSADDSSVSHDDKQIECLDHESSAVDLHEELDPQSKQTVSDALNDADAREDASSAEDSTAREEQADQASDEAKSACDDPERSQSAAKSIDDCKCNDERLAPSADEQTAADSTRAESKHTDDGNKALAPADDAADKSDNRSEAQATESSVAAPLECETKQALSLDDVESNTSDDAPSAVLDAEQSVHDDEPSSANDDQDADPLDAFVTDTSDSVPELDSADSITQHVPTDPDQAQDATASSTEVLSVSEAMPAASGPDTREAEPLSSSGSVDEKSDDAESAEVVSAEASLADPPVPLSSAKDSEDASASDPSTEDAAHNVDSSASQPPEPAALVSADAPSADAETRAALGEHEQALRASVSAVASVMVSRVVRKGLHHSIVLHHQQRKYVSKRFVLSILHDVVWSILERCHIEPTEPEVCDELGNLLPIHAVTEESAQHAEMSEAPAVQDDNANDPSAFVELDEALLVDGEGKTPVSDDVATDRTVEPDASHEAARLSEDVVADLEQDEASVTALDASASAESGIQQLNDESTNDATAACELGAPVEDPTPADASTDTLVASTESDPLAAAPAEADHEVACERTEASADRLVDSVESDAAAIAASTDDLPVTQTPAPPDEQETLETSAKQHDDMETHSDALPDTSESLERSEAADESLGAAPIDDAALATAAIGTEDAADQGVDCTSTLSDAVAPTEFSASAFVAAVQEDAVASVTMTMLAEHSSHNIEPAVTHAGDVSAVGSIDVDCVLEAEAVREESQSSRVSAIEDLLAAHDPAAHNDVDETDNGITSSTGKSTDECATPHDTEREQSDYTAASATDRTEPSDGAIAEAAATDTEFATDVETPASESEALVQPPDDSETSLHCETLSSNDIASEPQVCRVDDIAQMSAQLSRDAAAAALEMFSAVCSAPASADATVDHDSAETPRLESENHGSDFETCADGCADVDPLAALDMTPSPMPSQDDVASIASAPHTHTHEDDDGHEQDRLPDFSPGIQNSPTHEFCNDESMIQSALEDVADRLVIFQASRSNTLRDLTGDDDDADASPSHDNVEPASDCGAEEVPVATDSNDDALDVCKRVVSDIEASIERGATDGCDPVDDRTATPALDPSATVDASPDSAASTTDDECASQALEPSIADATAESDTLLPQEDTFRDDNAPASASQALPLGDLSLASASEQLEVSPSSPALEPAASDADEQTLDASVAPVEVVETRDDDDGALSTAANEAASADIVAQDLASSAKIQELAAELVDIVAREASTDTGDTTSAVQATAASHSAPVDSAGDEVVDEIVPAPPSESSQVEASDAAPASSSDDLSDDQAAASPTETEELLVPGDTCAPLADSLDSTAIAEDERIADAPSSTNTTADPDVAVDASPASAPSADVSSPSDAVEGGSAEVKPVDAELAAQCDDVAADVTVPDPLPSAIDEDTTASARPSAGVTDDTESPALDVPSAADESVEDSADATNCESEGSSTTPSASDDAATDTKALDDAPLEELPDVRDALNSVVDTLEHEASLPQTSDTVAATEATTPSSETPAVASKVTWALPPDAPSDNAAPPAKSRRTERRRTSRRLFDQSRLASMEQMRDPTLAAYDAHHEQGQPFALLDAMILSIDPNARHMQHDENDHAKFSESEIRAKRKNFDQDNHRKSIAYRSIPAFNYAPVLIRFQWSDFVVATPISICSTPGTSTPGEKKAWNPASPVKKMRLLVKKGVKLPCGSYVIVSAFIRPLEDGNENLRLHIYDSEWVEEFQYDFNEDQLRAYVPGWTGGDLEAKLFMTQLEFRREEGGIIIRLPDKAGVEEPRPVTAPSIAVAVSEGNSDHAHHHADHSSPPVLPHRGSRHSQRPSTSPHMLAAQARSLPNLSDAKAHEGRSAQPASSQDNDGEEAKQPSTETAIDASVA